VGVAAILSVCVWWMYVVHDERIFSCAHKCSQHSRAGESPTDDFNDVFSYRCRTKQYKAVKLYAAFRLVKWSCLYRLRCRPHIGMTNYRNGPENDDSGVGFDFNGPVEGILVHFWTCYSIPAVRCGN